jgi:hypothetical protein
LRWLLRIAAALVALLAIAGIAAVLVLPGLVESDPVRRRIERAARDATGRSLAYDSLEFGLLPPSLRVLGARVSGEQPGDEALLEARAVSLRVELLPLLVGAVVIDSLVIEAATLRLERGPGGLVLPRPPERAPPEAEAPAVTPAVEDEAGPDFSLAVRSVELRDATLDLTDRAVRPAAHWQLAGLDATARGTSLAQPIALDLVGTLASGGQLRAQGSVTTAGLLDLGVALDGLQLGPLAPYLGEGARISGALSGDVTLRGPADALDSLAADLSGRDVRFQQDDNALAGDVTLRADVATPTQAAAGSFELDATPASLTLGDGFSKPPGVPARVTGRIVPGAGGALAIEDVRLVIRNLEARGRVGSLSPFSVELSAPPFELKGWDALVPALASVRPTGRIGLEQLRFASGTRDLRGSVRLDGLVLRPREGAELTLRGEVRGEGGSLRSVGTTLETAGQVSDLDLQVGELFTTPRYRVKLSAREADSNQILTGLFAKPDTLHGPLGLDLSLAGAVGGDALQSLSGTIDFGVEPGQLVGVSLLRSVFDRLGSVGSLAVNLGRAFGGRDLQRFYGDEFELLRGALRVRDGIARTDDLTLRYRGYAVRLQGTLALADLGLDMSGELTIQEELDAAIARSLVPGDYQPRQRVVPLARVRGTLGDPKVVIDPVVATRFAAAYAGDVYADELRQKAEREIGAGTGELVDQGVRVLEGILGGGRARRAPEPAPGAEPAPAPPPPSQPESDAPAGP